MILSKFGEKFTTKSGILQLMDDLGGASNENSSINMLGGGNPAIIKEVNDLFSKSIHDLSDSLLSRIARYSSPQGDQLFIEVLADFLNRNYNFTISSKNVALTNGSQNAFFYLFNLFAGEYDSGEKNILLPMSPEYIGYNDVQIKKAYFKSYQPIIEKTSYLEYDRFFKYKPDFSKIVVDDTIGAMCCSRPTNPTGNILSDNDISTLANVAKKNDIPLIIDSAYGAPFPQINFIDTKLIWNENIILSLSLSKIGLPGVRTGIIIANEYIIQKITALNAVINLAPSNFGPAITTPLIENDQIIKVSNEIIRPYYQNKATLAIELLRQELDGYPFYIHQPEGAIFLWVWFEGIPISTLTLYQRLKDLGTYVVPGEYFFPGLEDSIDYKHKTECIRISYSQPEKQLAAGIKHIADQVKAAYNN